MAFGGEESLAPTKERKDLAVFERSVDHRDEAERVLVLAVFGEGGDFGISPGMRTCRGVRMMSDTLKGNL